MKDYYHTIPQFPRYQLNRQGVILDTQSRTICQPIKGRPYRCSLISQDGKRLEVGLKRVYRQVFNAEFCQDTIQDITGEVWKPIKNTGGRYFVSNKGRVKSYCNYNAVLLRPFDNGHGYKKVCILGKKYYIHQLVSRAFLGEPEPGANTIHHRNANRSDNNLENLCFMSLADNIREAHARRKAKE